MGESLVGPQGEDTALQLPPECSQKRLPSLAMFLVWDACEVLRVGGMACVCQCCAYGSILVRQRALHVDEGLS